MTGSSLLPYGKPFHPSPRWFPNQDAVGNYHVLLALWPILPREATAMPLKTIKGLSDLRQGPSSRSTRRAIISHTPSLVLAHPAGVSSARRTFFSHPAFIGQASGVERSSSCSERTCLVSRLMVIACSHLPLLHSAEY
jgi:hypothetical protein